MTTHNNPQDNVTVPRELLRQALYVIDAWERDCDYSLYGRDRDDAITALRTALEQPAVEPVAWVNPANLISAAIERARGGQGDTHTWSETRTAYHSVGLVPATQTPQQPIGWLRAVDEEMVSTHLGVADITDSYEDAKRKLNALICWHVDVSHDPKVNGSAQQPAPVQEPAPRNHITDGSACWCHPEVAYTDPDTGASVIVHKEPQ